MATPTRAVTADCPAWLSTQYCPEQGESCTRRHMRTMITQTEECDTFRNGGVCSFRCPLRHVESPSAVSQTPPSGAAGGGAATQAPPQQPVYAPPPVPIPTTPHTHTAGGDMSHALLLGETGSGKSTFLNYIANFFLEGTIDRPKVVIPTKHYAATESNSQHSEIGVVDQTKSQTQQCHRYAFVDSFVIIDSPGLADTNGVTQDEANIASILEAAAECSSLSALILVLNGTVARFTINMRTVLDRLAGTLPDGLMNNIILVFTNCADASCCSFQMSVLSETLGLTPCRENIFYMQNSLFSNHPSVWNNDTKARQRMQEGFDEAMRTINSIMQRIEQLGPCATAGFAQIRELRERLKMRLVEINQDIRQMLQAREALSQAEAQQRQFASDQTKFQNYTATTVITSIVLEDTTYYNTCCSACGSMCHENCSLSETATLGTQIFNSCWAFTGRNCTKCTGRCTSAYHFHARKRPRQVVASVDTILEDVKAQYDSATAGMTQAQQAISNQQQALQQLDAAINQRKGDIKTICRGLKAQCSRFNMVRELSTLKDVYSAQKAAARTQVEAESCRQIIQELDVLLQERW